MARIAKDRTVNELTIRQRRKQADIQKNLQKLLKRQRKKALLTAKDAKKPLTAYTGVGRDYAAAAGGGGGGGTFTSTDGLFTFFHVN